MVGSLHNGITRLAKIQPHTSDSRGESHRNRAAVLSKGEGKSKANLDELQGRMRDRPVEDAVRVVAKLGGCFAERPTRDGHGPKKLGRGVEQVYE